MTHFVTDLWQDLLEKRLWPVAVALIAAAVAVPVVLGKSPAREVVPAPTRSPVAVAGVPVLAGSPVRVGPTGFRDSLSNAPLRDPFKQQHLPAPPDNNSTIPRLIPVAPPGVDVTPPGSPGPGLSPGVGPAPGGGPGPRRAPATGVKLKLRLGTGGGALKTYEVAPLTALPSSSKPVLIYLGLLKDGKTASFLLSSDSNPQGNGKCKPSAGVCQTLLMKEGDTEFLDIDLGGGAAQYQLEVDRIIRG